jgi:hypothetical protein
MKYIVMECHEGYAVLMDEESRFVKSANLHYNVGQSVTDPILMDDDQRSGSIKMHITRFAAVAACIGVIATAGSMYYARNLKPYSTITISADANIKMEINQKGKVIHIKSDDKDVEALLKDHNVKGKDKLTAANEIIELEKQKGMISSGDTVNVYVDSDTSDDYSSFKNDLENGNSDLNLKVRGLDTPTPPAKDKATIVKPDPPKEQKTPEPPKPAKEQPAAPEPPAPSAITPPEPAQPPAPKTDTPKTETPIPDKKLEQPAPPSDPEPPKTPEKPDENAEKPEIKKPDEAVEPPKPPVHENEAEPLPPEPKKPLSIVEDALIDIQKNEPIKMESLHHAALLPAPEESHEEAAPDAQPPKEEHSPEAHTMTDAPLHHHMPTP